MLKSKQFKLKNNDEDSPKSRIKKNTACNNR